MLKKDEDATVEGPTALNPNPNPNPNPGPDPHPDPNPNLNQVETMLSRMWTAESEKAVTAALIDEYAAAATTAVGPEKATLETLTPTLTLTLTPTLTLSLFLTLTLTLTLILTLTLAL